MLKKFTMLTTAGAIALSLASGSAFAELTVADCDLIVGQAVAAAVGQASEVRKLPGAAKVHIFCLDKTGKQLASSKDPDAWVGGIDIAKAKAYSAMAFSSNGNAYSTRTLGCLTQPGTDARLFGIGNSNYPNTGTLAIVERGVSTIPGGFPLYKAAGTEPETFELVGGVGVSGDSVLVDENIAEAAAVGFLPPVGINSEEVLDIEYTYQDDNFGGNSPNRCPSDDLND